MHATNDQNTSKSAKSKIESVGSKLHSNGSVANAMLFMKSRLTTILVAMSNLY